MKRTGILGKLFGRSNNSEEEDFSNLNFEEQDMIKGVVTLSDTTVKEVMVPRIDVEFISNEASKQDLLEAMIHYGYSRYPVYKDTIDNVVGVLYVKDLLPAFMRNEAIDIGLVARKPYFVPESKRLDSLLKEFRRRKVHIAVAVDEYGGVSGIVCLEDIIEEIVGDIQDEFDNEEEDILEIGEGVYLCDARVDIEDLNEQVKLQLPDDDFDTLGGFVFDLFGKIPVRYEKVTYNNLDFIIQDMEGHKIKTVKVIKRDAAVTA
ncbi:hemolysin family protein [Sediminispirochaeta smaragdinae]|uniref:Transporter-associated region n=1 Tax=Sediminispirochaeta smaragdinae (strain DSM 11293 / JCM 15392 / SEBR 4228) TaxID=573413 RepID=E1R3D0_SEDSS|nr:hemolysin family protein [Sediminispirochaeta smaragdinae]ADK81561.1 transporter-associated region [Sediminispirochaeta smaragdinae DSM 11293]